MTIDIDHFEPHRSAPDPLREPITRLLDILPTASAFPADLERRVRDRLRGRVARSLRASRPLHTLRRDGKAAETVAPGVTQRQLYLSRTAVLRPGEPTCARVLDLAPGSRWSLPAFAPTCCEWLVLRGQASIGGQALGRYGFLRECTVELQVSSAAGAQVYLRLAPAVGESDAPSHRAGLDAWSPYGPGVVRRLLWTDGRQAAMLYHAVAGAAVPHHGHRCDEQCLMLEGELFLDDVLLQPGDYQLAPAGTEHREVSTDTGCLLFARGDLDLALVCS
jgi:mannose-6-phosphate isomerase-like protein (cupin superfamily)